MPNALLLLVLLFVPALPGTLDAAETTDPRQEVLAADARRIAAMVQGDLKALEGLLAEDLTYTHSNGQVETRTRFLEGLRAGTLRYLAVEPSDAVVRVHGGSALGTRRAALRGGAPGGGGGGAGAASRQAPWSASTGSRPSSPAGRTCG